MSSLQCASTLVLARPGEAEHEAGTWSAEGGSLTGLGRRQAAGLADRLASRRIAHVWTSTSARAVGTAEIAAARLGVSVTTHPALVEPGTGELERRPRDTDARAATYAAWLAGDLDQRLAGGESGAEVVSRVRGALDEIADAHRGETVLVVSNSGALRLSVPLLAQLDVTPSRLAHCSTIEVVIDDDDRVCRLWDTPGDTTGT